MKFRSDMMLEEKIQQAVRAVNADRKVRGSIKATLDTGDIIAVSTEEGTVVTLRIPNPPEEIRHAWKNYSVTLTRQSEDRGQGFLDSATIQLRLIGKPRCGSDYIYGFARPWIVESVTELPE